MMDIIQGKCSLVLKENFRLLRAIQSLQVSSRQTKEGLPSNGEEHFQFGAFEKKVTLDSIALVTGEHRYMARSYTYE